MSSETFSSASRHLDAVTTAVHDLLAVLRDRPWEHIPGTRRHAKALSEIENIGAELCQLLHPDDVDQYKKGLSPETASAVDRLCEIRGFRRVEDAKKATYLAEHCEAFLQSVQQPRGGAKPWYRAPGESKPEKYKYGSLEGTKEDLGLCLGGSGSRPDRALEQKSKSGAVWTCREHRRCFQVWFPSQEAFASANQKMIRLTQSRRPNDS